jgi:hypothetical protein
LPEEVYLKLSGKYQQRANGEPEPDYSEFTNFHSNDVAKIEMSTEDMCFLVWQLPNAVGPSIDQFRHEHLRQLFGTKANEESAVAEFKMLFTTYINRFVNGEVSEGTKPLYRDTSFCAAPKKNGEDVRPLGTVSLMRKIAGKVHNKLLRPFNSDNKAHPPLFQYAMGKTGNEKIIHTINASLQLKPGNCAFAMDEYNAFMHSNRVVTLGEVKIESPQTLSFVALTY